MAKAASATRPAKPPTRPAKATRLSDEIEGAVEVAAADVTHLNTPEFYGASVQLFVSSTDISVIFARQVPVIAKNTHAGMMLPAAVVHLSPGTAKDLQTILARQLAEYEAEWGEIQTAYTRRIAAEGARKKK